MADLTRENALKAMRIAHEKGDAEAARKMARLANSLGQSTTSRLMGQVNRSIQQGVGGLVDLVNPFDGGEFGVSTGSAVDGLGNAMTAIGAAPSESAPEGLLEGMAAGVGDAAAMAGPAAGVLKGLKAASSPLVRGIADEALGALLTKTGLATEVAAGAVSGGAGQVANEAGASPGVEALARIASPVAALAPLPSAARAASRLTMKTPIVGTAVRAGAKNAREISRAFKPVSKQAASDKAAERLRGLVGGEERAQELSRNVAADNEFGLTPAQQTQDPGLLGLERQAKLEDPLLRESLDLREAQARQASGKAIQDLGGDVATGQTQFQRRIKVQSDRMQKRIDQELRLADEGVEAVGPRTSESQASIGAVERIRTALDGELIEEKRLWEAVPTDDVVPINTAREVANEMIESTPRALQSDIPPKARELLASQTGFKDAETVSELHGLYSSLRQTAREASAGPAPNNNKARIANQIADGILMDLDAVDAATPLGKSINEARAFSRALHEKFDTGAVGRILKTTQQGDTSLTPESALRRTVRSGPEGLAANASIQDAAPAAREEIAEYLRGQFLDSAFDPSGTFSPKRAAAFQRNNRELLNEYPELRAEFNRSMTNRRNADVFAARTAARQALIENESAAARFALAQPDKAVMTIVGARDPVKAAKSIMASARKDPTFFSVDGVKGAFTDYLVSGGTRADGVLAGSKLDNFLTDKRLAGALKQVFNADELNRLKQITKEVAKVDPKKVSNVDAVLDDPANKILDFVVTTIAARRGAALGAGTSGASLKTSSMASAKAKEALKALSNTAARQILMDAIEDPKLMKALLSTPASIDLKPALKNVIAPYLIGGASTISPEGGEQSTATQN